MMNQNDEHIQRLTSCLYAVVHLLGGTFRIRKDQMEKMPENLDIAIHVDNESRDIIITTDSTTGTKN